MTDCPLLDYYLANKCYGNKGGCRTSYKHVFAKIGVDVGQTRRARMPLRPSTIHRAGRSGLVMTHGIDGRFERP